MSQATKWGFALISGGALAGAAVAENSNPILGAVQPSIMSDAAMAKVHGGVLVATGINTTRDLLGFVDNQITGFNGQPIMLAFDLTNPRVQTVLAEFRSGQIPQTWAALLPQLKAADPNGVFRCTAVGQSTPNGPAIPGLTVGIPNCHFVPLS